MKTRIAVLTVLAALGLTSSGTFAGILDETVFRTQFGGDSVNDITVGDVTSGTLENGSASYSDIPAATNPGPASNGRRASFGNGRVDYGVNNELNISGSQTWHARVIRYSDNTMDYVMGRWDGGQRAIYAYFTKEGQLIYGASDAGGFDANYQGTMGTKDQFVKGVWYDVFLIFDASNGEFRSYVYDSNTQTELARGLKVAGYTALYTSTTLATTIGDSRYSESAKHIPFHGAFDEVNVWGKALTGEEMQQVMATAVLPLG